MPDGVRQVVAKGRHTRNRISHESRSYTIHIHSSRSLLKLSLPCLPRLLRGLLPLAVAVAVDVADIVGVPDVVPCGDVTAADI